MKKKKVVLFDIDYTLFDTALFREKLYKAISRALHIDIEELSAPQKEVMEQIPRSRGAVPKIR